MNTYHVMMDNSEKTIIVLQAESFNIYEQLNEVAFWDENGEQCGFFKLNQVLGVVKEVG